VKRHDPAGNHRVLLLVLIRHRDHRVHRVPLHLHEAGVAIALLLAPHIQVVRDLAPRLMDPGVDEAPVQDHVPTDVIDLTVGEVLVPNIDIAIVAVVRTNTETLNGSGRLKSGV